MAKHKDEGKHFINFFLSFCLIQQNYENGKWENWLLQETYFSHFPFARRRENCCFSYQQQSANITHHPTQLRHLIFLLQWQMWITIASVSFPRTSSTSFLFVSYAILLLFYGWNTFPSSPIPIYIQIEGKDGKNQRNLIKSQGTAYTEIWKNGRRIKGKSQN